MKVDCFVVSAEIKMYLKELQHSEKQSIMALLLAGEYIPNSRRLS